MGPTLKNGLPRPPSGKKGKVFVEDKSALLNMIDAMPRFQSAKGTTRTSGARSDALKSISKGKGKGKAKTAESSVKAAPQAGEDGDADLEEEEDVEVEEDDNGEKASSPRAPESGRSAPPNPRAISSTKGKDNRKRKQEALKQTKAAIVLAAKQKKQVRKARAKGIDTPGLTRAGRTGSVALVGAGEGSGNKRKSVGFALP